MLGNFHTQLSSLAAIGYLMKNTGFMESISLVYGENSTKYIMAGKDYERAVRCHGLTDTALKMILIDQLEPDKIYAIDAAKAYFDSMMTN